MTKFKPSVNIRSFEETGICCYKLDSFPIQFGNAFLMKGMIILKTIIFIVENELYQHLEYL